MSAPAAATAAPPPLTLLPAGAPPPSPRPLATPLTPERRRQLRRTRAVCTAMCVTGALLPVPCVAAAQWLHGWEYVGMVVSWVFLLPAGGLALLLCALMTRTADDAKALLLAIGAFAAGIALLQPASGAGMEAYVSSHAFELDAVAAAIRAEVPAGSDGQEFREEMRRIDAGPLVRRLTAHRMSGPWVMDGGMVFTTPAFVAPSLFYADGVASRTPFSCHDPRAIGGRWYLAECPSLRGVDSD